MLLPKEFWTAIAVLVLSSQAYIIVARVLRLLCHTYFRKIIVYGINNLPREGPVIVCSNHPNMMVDVLLVATECVKHGRRPYIWAKGALFKNPVVALILRLFGAVPVYRPQKPDNPSSSVDVDCDKSPEEIQQELVRMFEATWKKLDAGHTMLLFPEGTSYTAPQMLKLRTGVMRLATGFAKRYDRPIPVVPIGLTYFNKDRFRSHVVLEFGAPLQVTPDMVHSTAFVEDERSEVKRLTEQLETKMRGLTLNAEDYETIHIARAIRRLYLDSAVLVDTSKEVRLTQHIIDLLERFDADKQQEDDASITNQPTEAGGQEETDKAQAKDDEKDEQDEACRGQMVRDLYRKVECYGNALEASRLRDQDLVLPINKESLKDIFLERLLYLLVLVPLALPTVLLNVPFFFLGNKLNKLTNYTETRSQLKIGAASVMVPTQWLFLIFLGWLFVGPDCAYVLALGLPLLLYCHIRVMEEGRTFVENVRFLWSVASHQKQAEELRELRKQLVVEVQQVVRKCLDPQLLMDIAREIRKVPSPRYKHRESKTLL